MALAHSCKGSPGPATRALGQRGRDLRVTVVYRTILRMPRKRSAHPPREGTMIRIGESVYAKLDEVVTLLRSTLGVEATKRSIVEQAVLARVELLRARLTAPVDHVGGSSQHAEMMRRPPDGPIVVGNFDEAGDVGIIETTPTPPKKQKARSKK